MIQITFVVVLLVRLFGMEWLLGTGPHGQPDGTLEMRTVVSFCCAATRLFAVIHLHGFSIEEGEMGRNDSSVLI